MRRNAPKLLGYLPEERVLSSLRTGNQVIKGGINGQSRLHPILLISSIDLVYDYGNTVAT